MNGLDYDQIRDLDTLVVRGGFGGICTPDSPANFTDIDYPATVLTY